MTRPQLVLRYGFFAVLATLANLGAQRAVLAAIDGTLGYASAVFTGTAVGLVLKYLLDKRWIFSTQAPVSEPMAANSRSIH